MLVVGLVALTLLISGCDLLFGKKPVGVWKAVKMSMFGIESETPFPNSYDVDDDDEYEYGSEELFYDISESRVVVYTVFELSETSTGGTYSSGDKFYDVGRSDVQEITEDEIKVANGMAYSYSIRRGKSRTFVGRWTRSYHL